ncbi:hypothetical protein G9A89_007161 [Geosiphon pyriformis]|nr:hypothetical protein G9A89_007161 [Geosiphon pyriformis]
MARTIQRGRKSSAVRDMEKKYEEIEKLFDFDMPCGRLASVVIKALLIDDNRPSSVIEITNTLIKYGLTEHEAAEPSKSVGSALTKYFRNKRKGDPLIREMGERGCFYMSLDRNNPVIAQFYPPEKKNSSASSQSGSSTVSNKTIRHKEDTQSDSPDLTNSDFAPTKSPKIQAENLETNAPKRIMRSHAQKLELLIPLDESSKGLGNYVQKLDTVGPITNESPRIMRSHVAKLEANNAIQNDPPKKIRKPAGKPELNIPKKNNLIPRKRNLRKTDRLENLKSKNEEIELTPPQRRRRVYLEFPPASPSLDESESSEESDIETDFSKISEPDDIKEENIDDKKERPLRIKESRRNYGIPIKLTPEKQALIEEAGRKFSEIEHLFNFLLPGGHLMMPIVKALLMLDNKESTIAEITDLMVEHGLTVHNAEEPSKSISSSVSKYFKNLGNDPSPLLRIWQQRRATLMLDESHEEIARILGRQAGDYVAMPGPFEETWSNDEEEIMDEDSDEETQYDTASEMYTEPVVPNFTEQTMNQHTAIYRNVPPSSSPRSAFSLFEPTLISPQSMVTSISSLPSSYRIITVPAGHQVALTHDFSSSAFTRMDRLTIIPMRNKFHRDSMEG